MGDPIFGIKAKNTETHTHTRNQTTKFDFYLSVIIYLSYLPTDSSSTLSTVWAMADCSLAKN